jgi:hypothetical protein
MLLRMTLRAAALVLAAPWGLGSAALAAGGFFSAVEDMPLMSGLSEVPSATTVFDKPEGRIVALAATGLADRNAVLKFYDSTLPQLGWRKAPDGSWRREEEMLRIEVKGSGRNVDLRISIAPSRVKR